MVIGYIGDFSQFDIKINIKIDQNGDFEGKLLFYKIWRKVY